MTASSPLPASTLVPLMRYRDLASAIKWLEEAFGFEKQVAVSDANGNMIYAQMTYGTGMIMLGSVRNTDLDKLMCQPDEVGGVETQSCYVVVENADAHYLRAREAGAEIVLELKSDGFGRRGYSCRDPQGHIWNFGTYNPTKGLVETQSRIADKPAAGKRPRLGMLAAALLLPLCGAWWWTDGFGTGPSSEVNASTAHSSEQEIALLRDEIAKLRGEKRKADQAAEMARQALEAERNELAAAKAAVEKAETALAEEKRARSSAEADAAASRAALAVEQRANEEALKLIEGAKAKSSDLVRADSASNGSPEETSALPDTVMEPESEPEQSKTVLKRAPMHLSSRPRRHAATRTSVRYKPTYLVDLAEVPWPYSTWYGKRRTRWGP